MTEYGQKIMRIKPLECNSTLKNLMLDEEYMHGKKKTNCNIGKE